MSCGSRFATMRVCLKMVMNSRYDNHPVKKLKTATTPEILHVSLPIPTPSLSLEVTNILLSLLFMAFPNPTDGQHTIVISMKTFESVLFISERYFEKERLNIGVLPVCGVGERHE